MLFLSVQIALCYYCNIHVIYLVGFLKLLQLFQTLSTVCYFDKEEQTMTQIIAEDVKIIVDVPYLLHIELQI